MALVMLLCIPLEGVPWCLSGLRTQCCHCWGSGGLSGAGSTLGVGITTSRRGPGGDVSMGPAGYFGTSVWRCMYHFPYFSIYLNSFSLRKEKVCVCVCVCAVLSSRSRKRGNPSSSPQPSAPARKPACLNIRGHLLLYMRKILFFSETPFPAASHPGTVCFSSSLWVLWLPRRVMSPAAGLHLVMRQDWCHRHHTPRCDPAAEKSQGFSPPSLLMSRGFRHLRENGGRIAASNGPAGCSRRLHAGGTPHSCPCTGSQDTGAGEEGWMMVPPVPGRDLSSVHPATKPLRGKEARLRLSPGHWNSVKPKH